MQPVNQWKNNIKNQSHSVVWLTAFVLAVLVVATVSVVGACLYKYVHHSDCEISLYDGQMAEPVKTAKNASAQMAANPVIQSKATQYKGTQAKQQSQKSSFNVTDVDEPFDKVQIKGKVIGWVPVLGGVVSILKTPAAMIVILLGAFFLIEGSFRAQKDADEQQLEAVKEEIRRLKAEMEAEKTEEENEKQGQNKVQNEEQNQENNKED